VSTIFSGFVFDRLVMSSAMLNKESDYGQMKNGWLGTNRLCCFSWKVVSRAGLEPATHWLKVRTIPLSAVFCQYQKSPNL
jgi:hypothetical protein